MRILVALDDSPASARAARSAVRLFSQQPDVEFLVLNVADAGPPWVAGVDYGFVGPMTIDPGWYAVDEPEEELESSLLDRARAVGLSGAEPLVRSGDPVQQICTAAEEHQVDVIVVGSHDKGAILRLFEPSVASGVVRSTHLPVLVVSGSPPDPQPRDPDVHEGS